MRERRRGPACGVREQSRPTVGLGASLRSRPCRRHTRGTSCRAWLP